jgi:hypothetical protein
LQVKAASHSIAAMADLAATELQLPPGSAAVVTNGRTVVDFNPSADNATLAPGMYASSRLNLCLPVHVAFLSYDLARCYLLCLCHCGRSSCNIGEPLGNAVTLLSPTFACATCTPCFLLWPLPLMILISLTCSACSLLSPPTALQPQDFALLQLYGASFSMGELLGRTVRAARSKKGADAVLEDPAAASDVVMVAAAALSAQVYPDSRWGATSCKQLWFRCMLCAGCCMRCLHSAMTHGVFLTPASNALLLLGKPL